MALCASLTVAARSGMLRVESWWRSFMEAVVAQETFFLLLCLEKKQRQERVCLLVLPEAEK